MKSLRLNRESGAVSLFVVIFAMLIITVLTVSFLRLMMADQRQASDSDLSQSAYDSAQAGVEDAKRALLRYQQVCSTSPPAVCADLSRDLSSEICNEALTIGNIAVPVNLDPAKIEEVKVQQTESVDGALDQAYTCVTMQLETDDYVGSLAPGESHIVPLVGRDPFSTVTVKWFSKDDVSNDAGEVDVRPTPTGNNRLISQDEWGADTPSVLRTQLIQFGSEFNMTSFDAVGSVAGVTQSNANTVFLYPTSDVTTTTAAFTALDNRKTGPTDDPDADTPTFTPYRVQCTDSVDSSTDYSCSMTLTLPEPIGGGTARTAFLRLTPYYNATSYQVILSNGDPAAPGGIVRFKDVQPIVDSTGRANDIFRRVQSRVDLYNTNFPYPDATIDITGNFCKNFAVSDNPDTYTSSNTCTP